MSEELIIRHCAPTLAGIKTGSLFLCPYRCKRALLDALRRLNRRLVPKGLHLLPLCLRDEHALLYLYRPSRLCADLAVPTAARLLARRGYPADRALCLAQLIRRFRHQQDFPHEIGLFLGYPPEDVWGFIENKARRCKYAGCWKVYGDVAAAQKTFAQYRKCTRTYCERWAKGVSIEQLTVAG